jgi:nitrogenase molybdenum-iron protein alpha chain
MNLLKSKTAVIRENRLQTLSAYSGLPDALLSEFAESRLAQRVRTFSQDTFSDMQYALNAITSIKNAATVVHGAAGCGVSRLTFRPTSELNGRWLITNLNERDSIMGGDAKLRKAIRQAHQLYRPEIIFILTTPVVAINNDDVESVVSELKDEMGVAIVPVYTDGFRSKSGVMGYDTLFHAIVKHLLPAQKPDKISGLVNLLSVSENAENIKEISSILHNIGLRVNLFPQQASLENIKRLPLAEWSIAVNSDESGLAGALLEKCFDIPFLDAGVPAGFAQTEAWINRIAESTGRSEPASRFIRSEKDKWNAVRDTLSCPKQNVFVNLPPLLAFAVSEMLEELGHEIAGLKLPYLDIAHIARIEKIKLDKPDFSFCVGDGQVFEEENVLQKLRPGLYIGQGGDYAAAIRNGIPAIDVESLLTVGFKGVVHIAKKIKRTVANSSFTNLLAEVEARTYSDGWSKKNANWYIKKEVK